MFHVLNRNNARRTFLEKSDDDAAFERVLRKALARVEIRELTCDLMPETIRVLNRFRERGQRFRFKHEWKCPTASR